jgi:hypothetical protein
MELRGLTALTGFDGAGFVLPTEFRVTHARPAIARPCERPTSGQGAFPRERPPTSIVSLPIPALIVLAFILPYFRRFPICRLGRP